MTTSDLKLKFAKDIVETKSITDLIDVYGDFEDCPEEMLFDPDRRVFTWWQFKADVLQSSKVVIGLRVSYPSVAKNEVYKNFKLGVLVLCHKSLMDVKRQKGNRLDLIADEIEKLWTWDRNGTDFRMHLISNTEDTYNDDYYCRILEFRSYTGNNYDENGVRRNV